MAKHISLMIVSGTVSSEQFLQPCIDDIDACYGRCTVSPSLVQSPSNLLSVSGYQRAFLPG